MEPDISSLINKKADRSDRASQAWTVVIHSNTGVVDSNPTWGMGVCVCVSVVLCR
jgi:hypothetical protein